MHTYDTIIIGLGGMGSAAAMHLAARGQRVLGLERFGPAHSQGSSHGYSRIIRQAYFEDPAYVPLLLRAYELWEALQHESGHALLTITGGLMIGTPDSATVAGSLRSAREHGLYHELLDAAELRRRYPAFHALPGTVALYEQLAGFLHPEATVRAHQEQAARFGADLHFHEPVDRWEAAANGEGVRVTTAQANYAAGRLIIAPGAWAPQLMADLNLPLVVERQVLYWFDPSGGMAQFQPDRFPIYIWDTSEPGEERLQFYGFPAQPGPPGGAKVAFFRHGSETVADPMQIDRTVHAEEVARMQRCLARWMPDLNGPLLHAATCMYTTTPDEHFIVGAHPHYPQVTLASPCSGHGYKFASVIGEILADLAADGTTRHPISLFAPGRFHTRW